MTKKENRNFWEKFPYWLRGGIIGLVLGFLFALLFWIIYPSAFCSPWISEVEGPSQGIACNYALIRNIFLIIPGVFIFVGVLVGLIVGKIKKKEERK